MQGGSGNNHNMNHIVKRIETRVLAPPGGFSSFSLGGSGSGGGGDVHRKHNYKNPHNNRNRNRNSNHNHNQPISNPQETKAAIQDRATKALLAAYDQHGQGQGGGITDSLDSLMPQSQPSSSIPGLEKHYSRPEDSSPQHQQQYQRQKQQPLDSPQPVAIVSRQRTQQQTEDKASSRIQKTQYADALQDQIRQKQQLDTRKAKDPYADRRSLRKPSSRSSDQVQDQSYDDHHQTQSNSNSNINSNPSSYVFSSPLRGVGGGDSNKRTSTQSAYAQQLKDQISMKKDLHNQAQHRQVAASLRTRRPRSSEDIDDSLSSLSRMGGEAQARKANQHSNARQYADQLQHQINTKQQMKESQSSSGGGGAANSEYNTDKFGNRVGNKRSQAVGNMSTH